jgi:hypothetical protein
MQLESMTPLNYVGHNFAVWIEQPTKPQNFLIYLRNEKAADFGLPPLANRPEY